MSCELWVTILSCELRAGTLLGTIHKCDSHISGTHTFVCHHFSVTHTFFESRYSHILCDSHMVVTNSAVSLIYFFVSLIHFFFATIEVWRAISWRRSVVTKECRHSFKSATAHINTSLYLSKRGVDAGWRKWTGCHLEVASLLQVLMHLRHPVSTPCCKFLSAKGLLIIGLFC